MTAFKMSSYSYELLESLSLLNKGLVRMEKSGRKQRADHMPRSAISQTVLEVLSDSRLFRIFPVQAVFLWPRHRSFAPVAQQEEASGSNPV